MTEPIGKPFAGYKDFAACVKANSSKQDPQAYCATIQRTVEKLDAERFEIVKVDEERRLVFGWASVAVRKDGSTVLDLQRDMIDPVDLETAAYRYVLEDGDANEMHGDDRIGRPVESFVVTPEKLQKMGLAADALPLGWWLGIYVEKDAAWDDVKTRKVRAFSIEGKAERVAA